MKVASLAGLLLLTLLPAGCIRAPEGDAGFTLVSWRVLSEQQVDYVEHVELSRCRHNVLGVATWGDSGNHEQLVARALAEHDADAITNAELRNETVPALVYYRQCTVVEGDLVRFPKEAP